MKRTMKKMILPAAFAAALALVSCNKENLTAPVSGDGIDFCFNALPANTKTAFGAKETETNTYPVLWTDDDKSIALTWNQTNEWKTASRTEGIEEVRFNAEIAAADSYTFYAVSPESAALSIYQAAQKGIRLNVNLPSGQTCTASGPDATAQVLCAASETVTSAADAIDLPFNHISAYIRLTIKNLDDESAVQSVSLTSEALDLTGRLFYFPDDGSTESNAMAKTVSVSTENLSADGNGYWTVWFGIAPVDLTNETLTLKVTTENGVYAKDITFTPTGTKTSFNLASGRVASFSVDMTGIDPEGIAVYTKVNSAEELAPGDIILIAAAGYDYALSTTQKDYNREAVATNKDGDNIKAPSDAVQILTLDLGYKPGEFALLAGDGSYLYYDSSITNNNLKTTQTFGPDASWNIGFNANTAIIKEIEHTRMVRYNINSGNPIFATYDYTNSSYTPEIGLPDDKGNTKFVSIYRKNGAHDGKDRFRATMPADGTSVGGSAASLPVYVMGNVSWTASVTGEGATLVDATTQEAVSSGSGEATLALSLPALTGTAAKTFTVTISTDAGVTTPSYTFSITQVPIAVGEVIWSETWEGVAANSTKPSAYLGATDATGTYCWQGIDGLAYSETGSSTTIKNSEDATSVYFTQTEYADNYKTGDKVWENVLIAKGGGTWTVSGITIPEDVKTATLYYRVNSTGSEYYTASSDSEGVTLSDHTASGVLYYTFLNGTKSTKKYYENSYTVTFDEDASGSFSLTFHNTNANANCRFGDIELVVTELY